MKTGNAMSQPSKKEYFRIMHARYQRARADQAKSAILEELCQVCGYHRKYAIRKLNRPLPASKKKRRRKPRGSAYNAKSLACSKRCGKRRGIRGPCGSKRSCQQHKLKFTKGARLTRHDDAAQTPPDRLCAVQCGDAAKIARFVQVRQTTNPFALAATIARKVEKIWTLANFKQCPRVSTKVG